MKSTPYLICIHIIIILFIVLYMNPNKEFVPPTETQSANQFHLQLQGVVTKVVDGDTLHIKTQNGEIHKIRFLGVDTPESEQIFGPTATEFTKKRLLGKQIEVFKPYLCRGKYGRILGSIVIDGKDFSAELLENGLAYYFDKYEHDFYPTHRSKYRELQEQAKEKRIGVWSRDDDIHPSDFRRVKYKRK